MPDPPPTWTYSGDPATSPKDEIRFLIGDTDSAIKLLNDTEITYLLAQWMPLYDSITYVASVAAGVIATKFAGVVNITADGVSINTADLTLRYVELAARLRELYKAGAVGGVIDIANLMYGSELDPSIKPLFAATGMHDNVYAGQQNYGGQINPWDQASDRVGAPGESGP